MEPRGPHKPETRVQISPALSLATVVQHHPSRARELERLLPLLDGLNPVVVTDPGGKRPSTWRTHRLCLEALGDASHLLVLQDDAIPCARFADAARAAILEQPDAVVCLFVPGFREHIVQFDRARHRQQRWTLLRISAYVPLVATVYPAEHVHGLIEYTDGRKTGPMRADDAIVAGYVRRNRVAVQATVPCLVQHDDEARSLMGMPTGRGSAHRLACRWSKDAGSGWLGKVVESGMPERAVAASARTLAD